MKLILMYVYYDKHGDIKAITPQEDGSFSKDYHHVMLPLAEVEPFILGKKNSFEYMIKKSVKVGGETMNLVKKYSNINLTRSMDNYLTKVNTSVTTEPIVKIITNTGQKKIDILLNPAYRDMYEAGTEEERDAISDFISAGRTNIHITEKNNPYNLFLTLSFLPKELFDKLALQFSYDENLDLSSSSAYTKRLVASYKYLIKDYKNAL